MKSLLTVFLLAGLCSATHAQGLRHVQGINLIGVSCGIAPGQEGSTSIFGLNYSKYLRKNWVLNLTGLYETGNIQTTKAKNYMFNGGADYTAFQAGNFFFFNIGLSVLAGGETLGNAENSKKKNSFVAGCAGNMNIELYFSDRIVFQVKAEQNYLPGSNSGKWYPAFYAGLKYCIF